MGSTAGHGRCLSGGRTAVRPGAGRAVPVVERFIGHSGTVRAATALDTALHCFVLRHLLYGGGAGLDPQTVADPSGGCTCSLAARAQCTGTPPQTSHPLVFRPGVRSRLWAAGSAAAGSMACQTFVDGMAILYDQQAATYAYRVYLHSENGSVSDALWQQLAEAAPGVETVQVEEFNAPAEGGMFRLLILEDAVFDAWYGRELPLSQDGLPYIRADAVSDGPAQAPPMAGTQPVMVGWQQSPLPLGIGRIPEEEHVTVGVTARSVFAQRVPDPLPERSLVVYYDTDDGRLLTPQLTALLDTANCRYTIQDYTPTSDWARQRQAIGLLLAAIRACFPPGILLLGGLEIYTVLYAQLLARRREFALLRSLGLPERTLFGTVFATGSFCLLGGVLAGLAGGAAVSALIAQALALPWVTVFPLGAPVYCALVFGAAGALAVFAALGQLQRIPASQELQQE